MNKAIAKALQSNRLVEDLKTAILGNIVVRIVDSKTTHILWSCHTGEFYNEFKDMDVEMDVEQDINLRPILEEIDRFLDETS